MKKNETPLPEVTVPDLIPAMKNLQGVLARSDLALKEDDELSVLESAYAAEEEKILKAGSLQDEAVFEEIGRVRLWRELIPRKRAQLSEAMAVLDTELEQLVRSFELLLAAEGGHRRKAQLAAICSALRPLVPDIGPDHRAAQEALTASEAWPRIATLWSSTSGTFGVDARSRARNILGIASDCL